GANGAIRSVNETFGVRGLISEQHSSNVVGAIFVGLKSRGTLAAPTAVVPNDFGAFFSNKWYDGTSYVQSGAFGFTVDGPVSQGVVPTRLSFVTSSTSGDGPTAHGVERMTVLSGGNVGIGTTTPTAKLHVAGASSLADTPIGILESSGSQMPLSFRSNGTEFARIRTNNLGNLVIATVAGTQKNILFRAGDDSSTNMFIQSSSGNVGIGTTSPDAKLEVSNGTILSSGSTGGRLGANNPNNQSASVNLDWFNDIARIRYGGTGAGASAGFLIQGQGDATKLRITDSGALIVTGQLFFGDPTFNPGDADGPQELCGRHIGGNDDLQITLCSSSIRYKEEVRDFTPGLQLASRLRPVSFRWKGGRRTPDFGLVAEEVAQVEPLLVTRNGKGEIEGVKYDRIGVLLLNAVQEQQAQIKEQQKQLQAKDKRIANLAASLARYESRLASLERFVARDKRTKRQVTARVSSTRKRGLRRATPPKAD
ncbi:MAG TPA: tail fiber domain-containing protein, partial [Pyrinomonadaceae bacterium]|nr:tail fiber domain-containing protein [Pyrinomonadaceae bacterium]